MNILKDRINCKFMHLYFIQYFHEFICFYAIREAIANIATKCRGKSFCQI